jgi:hypothetical protein
LEEAIKYRFYAIGRTGQKEVFPLNGNAFLVQWEKDDQDAFFSANLEGKMRFVKEDFAWFYGFETSIYRCDEILFSVHKLCPDGYRPDFITGRISLNGGDWDPEKCICDLACERFDKYTCFRDNAGDEFNLFSFVQAQQTAKLVQGELQYQNCGGTENNPQWCGPGSPREGGWILKDYDQNSAPVDDPSQPIGGYSFTARFVREVYTPPAGTQLEAPWIPIGNGQYAKPPALYNRRTYSTQNSYGYTYDVGGEITHGMRLRDVFTFFLTRSCSELTLKSDFFQWNPTVVTNINYVTGKLSDVTNLLLFQKSDVKRPTASMKASVAEISFEDLLSDICNLFQLKWFISDAGEFVIEHFSFFNKEEGLNVVGRYDSARRIGHMGHSYDSDNIPRREVFTMMDQKYLTIDFAGTPILYNNFCVGGGKGNEKTYQVENIMTDVQLALSNSSSESAVVSDDGFVLIACNPENGIISKQNVINNGGSLNNALAWSLLHEAYWRHGRYFRLFKMNNRDQRALSTLPTKLGRDIQIELCCSDAFNFDPNKLIVTDIGAGTIKTVSYDLYREILTVGLLYDSEENLANNQPPVAVDDEAITWMNTPVLIDVLANDYDPDPEGQINPDSLTITYGGLRGTSRVVNGKIEYTPNQGFSGTDRIFYIVSDDFNEPSNAAAVSITIRAGTEFPVANDDTFRSPKNKQITTGSLLNNDTGDGQLTVIAENKPTTQGGSVQISASGMFTYTPATGFVGNDTFVYTIRDSRGNTGSGTVTMQVFEPKTIYIRQTSDLEDSQILRDNCNGFQTDLGQIDRTRYTYSFYENAAGTIPLNVDEYFLQVLVRDITSGTNNNTQDRQFAGSGTSISRTITSYYDYRDCNGQNQQTDFTTGSLRASADYVII